MNSELIKTRLLKIFGENMIAFFHGIRFCLFFSKKNPEPEATILPYLVQNGDITIDIGANGADWTYSLSKIVGKQGYVYAFEADPYYALATDYAIKILKLKNVKLFPFGLSDCKESLPLVILNENGSRKSGGAFIDKKLISNQSKTRTIELQKLDDLIHEFPEIVKVKLIKCDAEGFELFIFKGAIEIIKYARPYIILENGNFEMHGYTSTDVFKFFEEMNYFSYALVDPKTLSATNHLLEHPLSISVNRIMIPVEKLDRVKSNLRLS